MARAARSESAKRAAMPSASIASSDTASARIRLVAGVEK